MFKKGKGHSYNVADASTSTPRNLVQNTIFLSHLEEIIQCSLGSSCIRLSWFWTWCGSNEVVGVFKRYESVAFRGRVRPGGVQRLLELEGGGESPGREGGRRRGSDSSLHTSSQLARTPSDCGERRRNSSPAVAAEENSSVVRWGEVNEEELLGWQLE